MTAIMISLVAVVLLILVIGFFAMRYLRADDADEFEDMPAERGRPRGAGRGSAGQGGAGQGGASRGSAGQVGGGQEWGGDGRVVPMPARSQGRVPRQAAPGHPGSFERGQSRGGRDYPQGRPPAPARAAAEPDFAGADFRGSRSQPSRRLDDRRTDDRRTDERPTRRPAAASRGGRGKSDNMSGKDWDSLSDVDYWAELASDKPLTTTAQPAGSATRGERSQPERPQPERREPDRREADQPDSRKARPAAAVSGRADGPGRTEESTALLPVRRRPAAGSRPENIPGRYPESRPRREQPAAPDHGVAALARLSNGNGSHPVPGDDDPLTSPSFPAIRADDGRSYRRAGRPHAAEPEYQAPGGYPAPAPQYPADGGTGQNGYGHAAGYAPAQPPVPAGNPYGSYVTPAPARHGDAAAYGYLPPSQETQQYSQAPQVHAAPVYDRGGQYATPSHPYGPGQPGGYPVSAGGQYQQPTGADAGQGQYPEPGYGAEPYGSYPGY